MSIVCDQPQHNVPKNLRNEESCDAKSKCRQNGEVGGWSFLRSLSDNFGIARNRGDTDKVYIHPTTKRPKLSDKSLEMCTERLGSETGSECGDDIALLVGEATTTLIPPPPPPTTTTTTITTKPQEERFLIKKMIMSRSNSFPPPINSVRGSNHSRMVRSYGEDGRLVVRVVTVPSPSRCFVAERSEGRLRLCFSDHSSIRNDDVEPKEDESNVETFEEEEEAEEEEFNEEEEGEAEEEEGVEGNTENLEGKMGNKEYRRPSSRCKESGHNPKPMLNWKQQFWVAT